MKAKFVYLQARVSKRRKDRKFKKNLKLICALSDASGKRAKARTAVRLFESNFEGIEISTSFDCFVLVPEEDEIARGVRRLHRLKLALRLQGQHDG